MLINYSVNARSEERSSRNNYTGAVQKLEGGKRSSRLERKEKMGFVIIIRAERCAVAIKLR